MNFILGFFQRINEVYRGVRDDATRTWFTIAVAIFIVCTFSVVGIAEGQVQEALSNYIAQPIDGSPAWVLEATAIWKTFSWLRVVATFGAVLVFASTLRYWTARLLGSDIDDYEKLKGLDQWKKDFILIAFLLPWIGVASNFFVAHMLAVDRQTMAAGTLAQFIAGVRAQPAEFLLFTPFLTLSAMALIAPIFVHVIWSLFDEVRQSVSKSRALLLLFDVPLLAMFFGMAALFAWGGDKAITTARILGPLVIVCLSFAFLTATGSWLIDWGRRFRAPLFLIAVLIPFFISAFGNDDNHHLRVLAPASPKPYPLVDALKSYYQTAAQRGEPLILVSAEGGGIRAAYFVAGVLARLEDQCPGTARRVFAISGVSGGAVGAAAYVAALNSKIQPLAETGCHFDHPGPEVYQQRLHKMFADDHLSPSLGKQAFTELVQRWYPQPLSHTDRQSGLEESFEQTFRREFNQSNAFESSAFTHQDGAPFLLLNTTRVDNGALYVETPLDLTNKDRTADVFDFRQALWPNGAPDFRLSTMALNSARFPIISPAGSVATKGGAIRFVDGGYFDNSGAESIVTLERRIREAAATLGIRPKIILLHIRPNPDAEAKTDDGGFHLDLDIHELEAVLATREGRVELSLVRMSELVPDCQYESIEMTRDAHIPFRLGWVLSASAAEALKNQVDKAFTPASLTASTCAQVASPHPIRTASVLKSAAVQTASTPR